MSLRTTVRVEQECQGSTARAQEAATVIHQERAIGSSGSAICRTWTTSVQRFQGCNQVSNPTKSTVAMFAIVQWDGRSLHHVSRQTSSATSSRFVVYQRPMVGHARVFPENMFSTFARCSTEEGCLSIVSASLMIAKEITVRRTLLESNSDATCEPSYKIERSFLDPLSFSIKASY